MTANASMPINTAVMANIPAIPTLFPAWGTWLCKHKYLQQKRSRKNETPQLSMAKLQKKEIKGLPVPLVVVAVVSRGS